MTRAEMEVQPHAFLTSALDRGVISFMPRALYPRKNSPRYLSSSGLGGPQSRSVLGGEEKDPPPVVRGVFIKCDEFYV
jgi:hypothetical protein